MDITESAAGPCAGIRVLDFTTVVSGPVCTQALGDLGADVLKVESLQGDMSRIAGGPVAGGLSGFFTQFNRNKRSIALDLKHEHGREIVLRLAAICDVVVENFRPGVADRIGIGFTALAEVNPRLIYAAISGFGPDGPYAELPAYDHVVQGLAGMMPIQGGAGAPQMFRTVVADKAAGQFALSAILAALLARERGAASGQRIEVPMLDAYAAFVLPEQLGPKSFPGVPESAGPGDLFRVYPTADGHVVGLCVQDDQYRATCEVLGRADLLVDERFATMPARFAHVDELALILGAEFGKWRTQDVIALLRERGAPFAPVNDFAGFLADAQVEHNGIVFEAPDPELGTLRMFSHPSRFSETPASLHAGPPRLGEHGDAILRLAGYDDGEAADLRERGVVR